MVDGQSLARDVVLTFFLMLVVVAVATDTRALGQGAAIAIGGTVALEPWSVNRSAAQQ